MMKKFSTICCLLLATHITSNLKEATGYYYDGESKENKTESTCSYQHGKYLCKKESKCIDLIDTCNGHCNCLDCSDEDAKCWSYDETSCAACRYTCLPTPDGPQCLCNLDTNKFEDICKEIDECHPYGPCDQMCIKYNTVQRCSCNENYHEIPNTLGQKCTKEVSQEDVLLYSVKDTIKIYNFTTQKNSTLESGIRCRDLAASHDHVYCAFSQRNAGYVFKKSISSGDTRRIHITSSPMIFSIDIDWITGNIYYTTDVSLGVCKNDGSICTELKPLLLSHSCYLSLAPRSGLMFYSIQDNHWDQDSHIMRSSMDGTNEEVLVTAGLLKPTSLTVDESSRKLYWLDSELGEIESIQFNGLNREIWFSEIWRELFSISVYEKNVFWYENHTKTIFKNFDKHEVFVIRNLNDVRSVHVYNPLLHNTKIGNPCLESSCTGLCLLRPSLSKVLNYTCVCTNYTDSNYNQSCNSPTLQSIWSQTNSGYEIRPPTTESPRASKSSRITSLLLFLTVSALLISFGAYLKVGKWPQHRNYDIFNNYEQAYRDERGSENEEIEMLSYH